VCMLSRWRLLYSVFLLAGPIFNFGLHVHIHAIHMHSTMRPVLQSEETMFLACRASNIHEPQITSGNAEV
jgi:hypothetical protein